MDGIGTGGGGLGGVVAGDADGLPLAADASLVVVTAGDVGAVEGEVGEVDGLTGGVAVGDDAAVDGEVLSPCTTGC